VSQSFKRPWAAEKICDKNTEISMMPAIEGVKKEIIFDCGLT
jgi:hypothetical protein